MNNDMQKMNTSDRITPFFISFLNMVVKELENDNRNSDLTNRKIKYYSDFIYNNGKQILDNNEHLSNYSCIFYLHWHNHNFFGKAEYCFLSDSEKEISRNHGSRKRYNRIPMDYHIHDVINCIENRDIPLLVKFFSKNIELFDELCNAIHLIV
jgi:hypothetical protein